MNWQLAISLTRGQSTYQCENDEITMFQGEKSHENERHFSIIRERVRVALIPSYF